MSLSVESFSLVQWEDVSHKISKGITDPDSAQIIGNPRFTLTRPSMRHDLRLDQA